MQLDWIAGEPLKSTSQALGLQTYATTLSFDVGTEVQHKAFLLTQHVLSSLSHLSGPKNVRSLNAIGRDFTFGIALCRKF